MNFRLQNYNEFRDVRWHDFVALIVNEFAVLLVRRYDFELHAEHPSRTWLIQLFGLRLL